jgi:hypothetical protein
VDENNALKMSIITVIDRADPQRDIHKHKGKKD